MDDKFKLPTRYRTDLMGMWHEYSELVAKIKPRVNLGLGFPDFPPLQHVTDALADVANSDNTLLNQYTRGSGHPRLVQNLSKLYSPLVGRQIDPLNEIMVGAGATQTLYSAILGNVESGDEVIIIEPFFDCYDAMVKCAGGVSRFIPLRPKNTKETMTSAEWVLNEDELESLFNPRTKMLILNTPHNPLGKIFTMSELQLIASLCQRHDVLCLSDEVYEWVVYDELNKHIRISTLPGMWERTITVGSAGKTFSVTGWRVGWAYGPAPLIRNLQIDHNNCLNTTCTPIQEAVARILEVELARFNSPECYLVSLPRELRKKRDYLIQILRQTEFKPNIPDGGYFIIADWTMLENKIDLSTESDQYKDYRFTKKFAKEASVVAIPFSNFYSMEHKHLGENYARFCFAKRDDCLSLTEELLRNWRKNAKGTSGLVSN